MTLTQSIKKAFHTHTHTHNYIGGLWVLWSGLAILTVTGLWNVVELRGLRMFFFLKVSQRAGGSTPTDAMPDCSRG